MHSLRIARLRQPGANWIGIALLIAAMLFFGLVADVGANQTNADQSHYNAELLSQQRGT